MPNLRRPGVLLRVLSVCGCALPGYYGEAINGEPHFMSARLPKAKRDAALEELMVKSVAVRNN